SAFGSLDLAPGQSAALTFLPLSPIGSASIPDGGYSIAARISSGNTAIQHTFSWTVESAPSPSELTATVVGAWGQAIQYDQNHGSDFRNAQEQLMECASNGASNCDTDALQVTAQQKLREGVGVVQNAATSS